MKSFKENYIDDLEEINKILEQTAHGFELHDFNDSYLSRSYYIDYKNIKFKLYARLPGKALPELYIFNMDGSKASKNKASGKKAFRTLQKMSNKFVFDYSTKEYKGIFWNEWNTEKGSPVWSVGYEKPLLKFNNNYNNCEIENCYSYDLNSSYAFAMLSDMPDCKQGYEIRDTSDRRAKRVQPDEIGFEVIDNRLQVINHGYATYVFKRVKSPFKSFVEKYYKAKKLAKSREERQEFKNILNYAVGYILRKNPFIHACILNNARRFIESFEDKNTLYINTDCIVSKTKREDIEELLGDEVGQFKIDHFGTFRRLNGAYQWIGEKPVARGISKEWFTEDFNLLTDGMPNNECNKYILDYENYHFTIKEKVGN